MIERITKADADAVLDGGHYLGETEYPPTCVLAERGQDGALDAVAVFAPPVAQHFKVKLPGCLELTRLWQSERRRAARSERGPLSKFVREALEWLRANAPEVPCVFSYTDPGISGPTGQPHHGAVYQAARFKCFGESRVTDYWVAPDDEEVLSAPVCYRRYHTKSREHLSSTALYRCVKKDCERGHEHVGPGLRLVAKPPKLLFVFGLTKSWREVRDIIGGRYADAGTKRPAAVEAAGCLPAAGMSDPVASSRAG
jgi:hypothetical protein